MSLFESFKMPGDFSYNKNFLGWSKLYTDLLLMVFMNLSFYLWIHTEESYTLIILSVIAICILILHSAIAIAIVFLNFATRKF